MHDGLHYPDNLYADHEERKARRSQQPTGAYRSAPEMPESERKLRTALSYVAHARDLITDALKLVEQERKDAYNAAIYQCQAGDEPTDQRMSGAIIDRIPKWDPAWGVPLTEREGYSQGSHTGTTGPIPQNQPPNCDGLSARDVREPHPMASETLRAEDEFDRDDKASGV